MKSDIALDHDYKVLFWNPTGCAIGISEIFWSVQVRAASGAEAVDAAIEQARMINAVSGMPPHGIRLNEAELRRLAYLLPTDESRL